MLLKTHWLTSSVQMLGILYLLFLGGWSLLNLPVNAWTMVNLEESQTSNPKGSVLPFSQPLPCIYLMPSAWFLSQAPLHLLCTVGRAQMLRCDDWRYTSEVSSIQMMASCST
jgi:hypothetical protein